MNIKFKRTTKVLDGMTDRTKNPAPVLKLIGEDMRKIAKNRMAKHTDPDGDKWQKLAPSTKSRRKNKSAQKSSKMLYDSGKLRKSLDKFHIEKKAKVHKQYQVYMKSDLPYANVQNNGKFPNANNPLKKPRTFLKNTQKDLARYRKMIKKYIIDNKL